MRAARRKKKQREITAGSGCIRGRLVFCCMRSQKTYDCAWRCRICISFSAYAHSCYVRNRTTRSPVTSSTIDACTASLQTMLERAATITRGRDGDLATRQTRPAAVTRHYALASTSSCLIDRSRTVAALVHSTYVHPASRYSQLHACKIRAIYMTSFIQTIIIRY